MSYLADPNSPTFQFLLDNKLKFEELLTKESINQKIYGLYSEYYRATAKRGAEGWDIDFNEFEAALKKIKTSGFADAQRVELEAYAFYYKVKGDMDKYPIALIALLDKYGAKSAGEYNEHAWYFYENVEDKELLKKAVVWAKKSIATEQSFYNEDTLAALLYKLENYTEAEEHANKAIELAKADGMDAGETEALLDKIKAAQK
jgi:hypothetical protein